jgi:CRP-like cAMP-binding protein
MIDRLPLLSRIPIEDLNLVAGRVSLRRYATGQAAVRQGEAGDAFYVIRRGGFAVIRSDPSGAERVLRHLGPGEAFGELALLQGQPRAATVRAEEVAECFVIGKSLFERYLAGSMQAPEVSTVVEAWSLPPFRHLPEDEALALLDAGSWVNAVSGEMLIEQGGVPDAFYVLASGRVEVIVNGIIVTTLGAGDHFGEVALLRDSPRTASVRTLTPARLFRLDRPGFDQLVADACRRDNLSPLYDASANRD